MATAYHRGYVFQSRSDSSERHTLQCRPVIISPFRLATASHATDFYLPSPAIVPPRNAFKYPSLRPLSIQQSYTTPVQSSVSPSSTALDVSEGSPISPPLFKGSPSGTPSPTPPQPPSMLLHAVPATSPHRRRLYQQHEQQHHIDHCCCQRICWRPLFGHRIVDVSCMELGGATAFSCDQGWTANGARRCLVIGQGL